MGLSFVNSWWVGGLFGGKLIEKLVGGNFVHVDGGITRGAITYESIAYFRLVAFEIGVLIVTHDTLWSITVGWRVGVGNL